MFSNLDTTKIGRADTSGIKKAADDLTKIPDEYNADLEAARNRKALEVQAGQIGQVERVAAQGIQGNQMMVSGAQVGNADTQQSRDFQLQALSMAQQAAAGQGPSVAGLQQAQGFDQAMQAQLAMAAQARGGFNPAAMRNAQNQGAMLQAQAASQGGILRAQEMAQARGDLMTGATNFRGQDIGLAQAQAQLAQQATLANQATTLQASQADQSVFLQAAMANQQTTTQAAMAQAQMNQQASATNSTNDLQAAQMRDGMVQQFMNAGLTAGQAKLQAETKMMEVEQQRQNAIAAAKQAMQAAVIKGASSAAAMGATGGASAAMPTG